MKNDKKSQHNFFVVPQNSQFLHFFLKLVRNSSEQVLELRNKIYRHNQKAKLKNIFKGVSTFLCDFEWV